MRQPLVPRTGRAELRRAVHGVDAGQRVQHRRGGRRPEEVRARGPGLPRCEARLAPDLLHAVGPPVGEEAHRVRRRRELVVVRGHRVPRQPHVHVLAHVERRDGLELDPRHHAQRAERDDRAREVRVPAPQEAPLAVARDQLQPDDGARERADSVTRAVGRRRDGPRDGDVRERREVRERAARRLHVPRHVAVPQPRRDRGHARGGVDHDGRAAVVVPVEDDVRAGRVRDVPERVPGPERLDARRAPHDVGELVGRRGVHDLRRRIGEVPRPVRGPGGFGRRRHAPTLPPPSRRTRHERRSGTRNDLQVVLDDGQARARRAGRGVVPTFGRGRPGVRGTGRSGEIET